MGTTPRANRHSASPAGFVFGVWYCLFNSSVPKSPQATRQSFQYQRQRQMVECSSGSRAISRINVVYKRPLILP